IVPAFFVSSHAALPALYSFPTRRSSDLFHGAFRSGARGCRGPRLYYRPLHRVPPADERTDLPGTDPSAQPVLGRPGLRTDPAARSEEHTSELQSREHLVCSLLLEKKNDT